MFTVIKRVVLLLLCVALGLEANASTSCTPAGLGVAPGTVLTYSQVFPLNPLIDISFSQVRINKSSDGTSYFRLGDGSKMKIFSRIGEVFVSKVQIECYGTGWNKYGTANVGTLDTSDDMNVVWTGRTNSLEFTADDHSSILSNWPGDIFIKSISIDYSFFFPEDHALDPMYCNMLSGESCTFKASLDLKKQNDLKWELVQDDEYATIESVDWDELSATVTANKPGSATLYLTSAPDEEKFGIFRYANIRVITGDAESIDISPSSLEMQKDETREITVNIKPKETIDKTITWKSSPEGLVSVSPTDNPDVYTVKALGWGSGTLQGRCGNVSDKVWLYINPEVPVTSVSVAPRAQSIFVGETHTFTASVSPAGATEKVVDWELEQSGDYARFHSVDGNSVTIVGMAAGKAKLLAKAQDGTGIYAAADITVNDSPYRIQIIPDEIVFEDLIDIKDVEVIVPEAAGSDAEVEWSVTSGGVIQILYGLTPTQFRFKPINYGTTLATATVGTASATIRTTLKPMGQEDVVVTEDFTTTSGGFPTSIEPVGNPAQCISNNTGISYTLSNSYLCSGAGGDPFLLMKGKGAYVEFTLNENCREIRLLSSKQACVKAAANIYADGRLLRTVPVNAQNTWFSIFLSTWYQEIGTVFRIEVAGDYDLEFDAYTYRT